MTDAAGALERALDAANAEAASLRASRTRIVAASDAGRRRLERRLHAGAQQHLVALAVKVRLARDLLDDRPDDARRLLEELGNDVHETLEEVRHLAYGIFPPLLADGGLRESLIAAAGRSGLPVSFDLDDVGRYDEVTESAVYFACMEAIDNTLLHAGEQARLTVMVRERNGRVEFKVQDDGRGFDLLRNAIGPGLRNAADRLEALLGEMDVLSAPGEGTVVSGWAPVAPR